MSDTLVGELLNFDGPKGQVLVEVLKFRKDGRYLVKVPNGPSYIAHGGQLSVPLGRCTVEWEDCVWRPG